MGDFNAQVGQGNENGVGTKNADKCLHKPQPLSVQNELTGAFNLELKKIGSIYELHRTRRKHK